MTEELNQALTAEGFSAPKPKRAYTRRQPAPPQANPNIALLEADLVPLVRQRMDLANQVVQAKARATQSNVELQHLQSSLAQLEETIQYQQQIIAQMKGVPYTPFPVRADLLPSPPQLSQRQFADYPQQPPSPLYQPVSPYPAMPPPMPGVSSYPAPNQGLHPDASPRGYVVDPEQLVNNDSEYQFPPDVIAKINEGRR